MLIAIAEDPGAARNATARVGAAKAILDALSGVLAVPGWSPPPEPQGDPVSAPDDGTWAGGGEPEAKH